MALDAALLLPCPLCRELPDESPLSDVARWALFGVEQARASGGGSLPAPTSAGTGALTATAAGVLAAEGATGTGAAVLRSVGSGVLAAEGVTSAAAGLLRCVGTGAISSLSATCTAVGTAYQPSVGAGACVLPPATSTGAGLCFVPAPTGTRATLTLATSSTTAALAAPLGAVTLASSVATAAVAAPAATLTLAASATTAQVAMSFVLVEGDTLPVLTATLAVDGTATNLSGASVALRWSCGGARGEIVGTVTNAATGACSFSLAGVPAGRGKGEIVVTFADDETRTYPSAAPFDLIVRAAL